MANKVDVWRLAVMHRVEVIVAVDRVQGAVVGKLLLRDGWVILQTKYSIDVVLSFDGGQLSPEGMLVSEISGSETTHVHSLPFLSNSRVLAASCAV